MTINRVASLDYAVEAMRIAEAVADTQRDLGNRMAAARRADRDHDAQILSQTQRSTLQKAALTYRPVQRYSTVSNGKVRIAQTYQNAPPASVVKDMEAEILAARLTATSA